MASQLEDFCIYCEDRPSTDLDPWCRDCDPASAATLIEDIRLQGVLILGRRYRLSARDRNRFITVLETALAEARNGLPAAPS
jgi:hypothetical protein